MTTLWKVVLVVCTILFAVLLVVGLVNLFSVNEKTGTNTEPQQQEMRVRTVLPGDCIKALDEAEEFVMEGPQVSKKERLHMRDEYHEYYAECTAHNE